MIPRWHEIALGELGQTEVAGPGNNPRILEYHRATGLAATLDSVSWCSSFVAWCLLSAEEPYNKAKAASARSWLTWGQELKEPTTGAVTVLSRGPDAAQGHVGFYAGESPKGQILILGGNQGDAVSIKSFPKTRLLGFRWPAAKVLPPDIQPLRNSGVIQGSVAAGAGGAGVLVDAVVGVTSDLERADGHVSSGTIFGGVLGAIIVAAAAYSVWQRVKSGRALHGVDTQTGEAR